MVVDDSDDGGHSAQPLDVLVVGNKIQNDDDVQRSVQSS